MRRTSDGRDKTMYCVIVGDIVNSREMDFETREAATRAVKATLNGINTKYKDVILADFGIVRGDALEGVLTEPSYAPRILPEIIRNLYRAQKVTLRFSVVIDELSVVSNDRNEADGPAFHTALEKLDTLKARKSDHWLQVSFVTNTVEQPLVDGLFDLLTALTGGWTDRQREIAWAMDESARKQSAVSEALGISPPAVSKQLRAMCYDQYAYAWIRLEVYLLDLEKKIEREPVAV
ncbi:MAG: SatD family protein [Firmicutes bacterium]|nr:SatD family protein [Bacillota bacterium]